MVKEVDSNIVAAAFDNVFKFNDISKQFEGDVLRSIDLQLDLIWEEYTEVLAEMDELNSEQREKPFPECTKGLLKEAADLWVVASGLIQKLQAAGFPMDQVLLRVIENNLSKFPKKVEYNWCEKQGYTPVFNEKYACFVLKNANGKTCKPVDYKSVELTDLVPTNFFKEAQYG